MLRTSQIALPEKACRRSTRHPGYEQSRANIGARSLKSDMVFRDGY